MSGTPTLLTNNGAPGPALKAMGEHRQAAITIPGKSLRRWMYFSAVLASSLSGGWLMLEILRPGGLTPLELLLLILFVANFTWVVSAFWSAGIGFVLQLLRLDPYSLHPLPKVTPAIPALQSRTAVVMPVYNENTRRVIAGFESNVRALAETDQFDAFDFYLLSDTQDPALIEAERVAWAALQQRLGCLAERVYYRRRQHNVQRKVGNLADFCQRWGSNYEFMIVLDADSLMSGDCMTALAARMETNPGAGLIQTIPIPVRQTTLFGRFLQFAANLYSPLLATGYAFWQGDNANYWGHNAIIRVKAFIDCCGLPTLPGREPFGGDILSHDFVEAALLYRGGWGVYLAADLEGSFEEIPGNILDYAKRDRRWAQGNLQHLALLTGTDLSTVSRLHFLFGALAYTSSLFWFCMLVFSTVDAVLRATTTEVFFSQAYQLFPDWPIFETGLITSLLYVTVAILFTPKLMGCINALVHRREQFGGIRALITGTVVELVMAVIIAPLMMCFHAYFVVCVLFGLGVHWGPQPREGRMVSWSEAWRRTCPMVAISVAWGSLSGYFSPIFFFWLTPVLFGMLLAPVLVRYTSSNYLGSLSRRVRLFIIPSEHRRHPLLARLAITLHKLPRSFTGNVPEPALPPIRWSPMPIQPLGRAPIRGAAGLSPEPHP